MASAREEIMTRLHEALGREDGVTTRPGIVPSTGKPVDLSAEVPRDYLRTGSLDHEVVIAQLVDRLVDYRAGVVEAQPAEVPGVVAEKLAHARSVVVPPALESGVLAGLERPVLAELDDSVAVTREDADTVLSVDELDRTSAVVTSSRVSCAQTGTIFLDGASDCGRRAISLVPDHHVCLVPESSIVEIIPEAVARIDSTRTITMISGPSATSDIELERVEGVHGPRTLDVVIVRGV
ncbi:LUD domain-containing protein [Brevibacterium salitolerans]|uniref:LUD domain-containing protein n=2 Tax=Brevibacterium salitolerans TaxID=1403566 RepID=A0ABP5IFC7_9MICO